MADKAPVVDVSTWINILADEYSQSHQGKEWLSGSKKMHGSNNNISTAVMVDVVLRVPLYEIRPQEVIVRGRRTVSDVPRRVLVEEILIEISQGWEIVIYRRYDNQQKGARIATIFSPGMQTTILYNEKPRRFRVRQ